MKIVKNKNKKYIEDFLWIGVDNKQGRDLIETGIRAISVLSNVYAPFFAYYACLEQKNEEACLLKISTKNFNLDFACPFHGFLQMLNQKKIFIMYNEIINNSNNYLSKIMDYQYLWTESLKECGIITYNQFISKDEIIDYKFFNYKKFESHFQECYGPWGTVYSLHKNDYQKNEKILNEISNLK